MLTPKVINLFAGPGIGKSTTAAGLFNLMKVKGHSVELVSEFAKDVTYEKNGAVLGNQLYILGQQDMRLRRLAGQVEWAITDSPLPIGIAYMSDEYVGWLRDAVWGAFDRYQNYNVYLERGDYAYEVVGRNQNEAEAMALHNHIGHLFDEANDGEGTFALECSVDIATPYEIYDWIMKGDAYGG